jgi:hypothetical protein
MIISDLNYLETASPKVIGANGGSFSIKETNVKVAVVKQESTTKSSASSFFGGAFSSTFSSASSFNSSFISQ